jgi:hypothetical protein
MTTTSDMSGTWEISQRQIVQKTNCANGPDKPILRQTQIRPASDADGERFRRVVYMEIVDMHFLNIQEDKRDQRNCDAVEMAQTSVWRIIQLQCVHSTNTHIAIQAFHMGKFAALMRHTIQTDPLTKEDSFSAPQTSLSINDENLIIRYRGASWQKGSKSFPRVWLFAVYTYFICTEHLCLLLVHIKARSN